MIAGIIAEYNPFHKGHEYHIRKTKELTHADTVIAVISGDFVQRGNPSVISKYIRTRQALLGGADLVLELPGRYATAGAADFAMGGVCILNGLGVVDFLSFGCEETDEALLEKVADILAEEPDDYTGVLNDRLREGESFPVAREQALIHVLSSKDLSVEYLHKLISAPNNILAIEYLKALKTTSSKMKSVMIGRLGDGYNEEITGSGFASASGIRDLIEKEGMTDKIKEHVPDHVFETLKENYGRSFPVKADDFVYLIGEKVRQERLLGGDLTRFADVSEELANRIMNLDIRWRSFDEVCQALKTKQYTYSRISRALIHILLDIKKEGSPVYARVLGFRQDASGVLKEIQQNSTIPVITKVSEAEKVLSGETKRSFFQDIYASEIYEDRVREIYGYNENSRFNEYKQNLIIV